jgi:hypothetical protein
MTSTRAAALGLAALAGYAAVVITVPGQASAATAYRYWAYYVAHGTTHGTSWQYSQRGPASEYPVDGEVQGWRFAVQVDAANGLLPRAAPDFATLCASTPAKAGELRVGVVIDFGLATDAPAHETPPGKVVPGCVYVHDGATGTDVLAAATAIRIGTGADAGLVCGIDGYPKTECAVAVDAKPTPAAPTPSPTPSRASPRATTSTHSPATPSATPSAAPVSSAAATSSATTTSPPSEASSSVSAGSSDRAQSFVPTPATSSSVSLAVLRSNTRRGHGVAATTIAGIALIAILGGAAVWRTRARRR